MGGRTVVTCGGEPMLDIEPYFDLMRACREAGLGCLSVINGTQVTPENASFMLTDGPSEITVSFDHWQATEHDRLRGTPGSHAQAVRAIELLLRARAETGCNEIPIHIMTILSEDTWPTLDRFYEFAFSLGASWGLVIDKLKLNVMQPTFQGRGKDSYFDGARVSNVAECMAMIRACDIVHNLKRNPVWMRDVEMYLNSVNACQTRLIGWGNDGTTEAICNSYERNIMVDLYGRARLCFSNSYPAVQLNVSGDLKRFWYESSLPIRQAMLGCKQFCGISHSVRASSSLLRRI